MRRHAKAILLSSYLVSLSSHRPGARIGSRRRYLFRSLLDNSPLYVTPKPGEAETDVVRKSKASGKTVCRSTSGARPGKQALPRSCQACHLCDGKGCRSGAAAFVSGAPMMPRLSLRVLGGCGQLDAAARGSVWIHVPLANTADCPPDVKKRKGNDYGGCHCCVNGQPGLVGATENDMRQAGACRQTDARRR